MKHLLLLLSLFVSIGVKAQDIPSHLPKEGLVAWFPFSGNAEDKSGNIKGVKVNGASLTADRNSKNSDAYSLDGIDDYISIPHSNILNLKSYTISFWIQKLGLGTNGKVYWTLLSKNSSGSRFSDPFHIGYTSTSISDGFFSKYPNQLFMSIGGGSLSNELTQFSGIQLTNEEWYNIIISYDKNSKNLSTYVNGKLANQDYLPFEVVNNSSDINIGRWEGYQNYFKGKVDDLAIWNRVLSNSEVINYLSHEGKNTSEQLLTRVDKPSGPSPQLNEKPANNYNESETVKDIDGNIYHTIKIGNQIWMLENLKVTKYRNGDAIEKEVLGSWPQSQTGLYWNHPDDISNKKYGNIYNWLAVCDPRNIAPEGWHVPTLDEWDELLNYLSNGRLKEAKTNHSKYQNDSDNPNYHVTRESELLQLIRDINDQYSPILNTSQGIGIKNTTKFSLSAGGMIDDGKLIAFKKSGSYWTSTDIFRYSFSTEKSQWGTVGASSSVPYTGYGVSIRLIKGEANPPKYSGRGKVPTPSWADNNSKTSSISNSFCFGQFKVTLVEGGEATQTQYDLSGKVLKKIAGQWTAYGTGGMQTIKIKFDISSSEFSYELIRDGFGKPSVLIDGQGRRYTKCQ